jgi:hypothetical protein
MALPHEHQAIDRLALAKRTGFYRVMPGLQLFFFLVRSFPIIEPVQLAHFPGDAGLLDSLHEFRAAAQLMQTQAGIEATGSACVMSGVGQSFVEMDAIGPKPPGRWYQ